MPPVTRNVLVGLFVLCGTGIILWMAKNFRGGPQLAFLRSGYLLRLEFDNLSGLSDGAEVRLNGKRIGMVISTEVDPAAERPGIAVAEVEARYRIPAGTKAELTGEVFGRKYVELIYTRPPRSEADWLPVPADGPIVLVGVRSQDALAQVGRTVAELEVEMKKALREATTVMAGMNSVIDKNSAAVEKTITGISLMLGSKENQENLARALAFLGGDPLHKDIAAVVTGVKDVVTDPKLQENVRVAVADIRAISADLKDVSARLKTAGETVDTLLADGKKRFEDLGGQAGRIGNNLEALSKDLPVQVRDVSTRLTTDLEKLGTVLANLQAVTARLEKGEGTAGKLLSDAKLYDSMVDLARNLQLVSEDLRKMVKKWDEGGIKFRF